MAETEKLVLEINGFLKAVGENELEIQKASEKNSELDYLREVKAEYTKRLLRIMPQYKTLPVTSIPDMFLAALGKREEELGTTK